MFPFQFVLAALCAWRQREQEDAIAFLREENRLLKARIRTSDEPPFDRFNDMIGFADPRVEPWERDTVVMPSMRG